MSPGPRIALWGAFDVEDCANLSTRRVVETELLRRLPGAAVTAHSPLGARRALALDGGRPARPLPDPAPARLEELAAGADCVLVCGGDTLVGDARAAELWDGDATAAASLLIDGLGARLEESCPVVWAGVSAGGREPDPAAVARIAAAAPRRRPVAVLDEASRRWLPAAPDAGEVAVLPPYALLLPRLLEPELLRVRGDLGHLMEWSWPAGPVLTVHGDAGLLASVGELAAALAPLVESGGVMVQLGATGRCGGEETFAAALEAALGGRCRRLPGAAPPEDHAAALAGSAAFAGPRGFGLWVARALGVPAACLAATAADGADGVLLDELGVARVAPGDLAAAVPWLLGAGPAPPQAAVTRRLDAHLDRLAGLAVLAAARRVAPAAPAAPVVPEEERLATLLRAHQARGLRLLERSAAVTSVCAATISALEQELDAAHAEADRLRAELAAARAATEAVTGSRTWRYSQPVRDAVAHVRERRR
jgi:hypothetical protein